MKLQYNDSTVVKLNQLCNMKSQHNDSTVVKLNQLCNMKSQYNVVHLFSVLCFCFVCLRPAPCVPNVARVSGLSILDYSFGFL